jgi:hypothetical protein
MTDIKNQWFGIYPDNGRWTLYAIDDGRKLGVYGSAAEAGRQLKEVTKEYRAALRRYV